MTADTLADRLRSAAAAIRHTAAEVSIVDGEGAQQLAELARKLIQRADDLERGQAGLPPLGLDDPIDRLRASVVDVERVLGRRL